MMLMIKLRYFSLYLLLNMTRISTVKYVTYSVAHSCPTFEMNYAQFFNGPYSINHSFMLINFIYVSDSHVHVRISSIAC
jgi:hypothetical protein